MRVRTSAAGVSLFAATLCSAADTRRARLHSWLAAVTIAAATAVNPSWAHADAGAVPVATLSTAVHQRFDDGTLTGWNTRRLVNEDSAVVQDDIEGRRAVRIELRPGDYVSDGWRAELKDPYSARVGEELWYGFGTLVPTDYPTS